jgi:glycosyltransferase involved in cell wall biosynthesis
MKSLVTICITTYNRKELLPLTLKSILNQTYKDIEIIIVDDFSSDGTQELIENELLKWDRRIKYVRHSKNNGLAFGRNTAINNAKGKYFTFCDDDDEWEDNFIEEFVKIADSYGVSWCFYCGCKYKNLLGTMINIIYDFEGTIKEHIKNGYTPPVASQFYRLESLKEINGYNENIKSGVDHDLWLRLATININIKSIPKALSIPNANARQERMTTNYEKRINGIKSSLLIWENDIESLFGKKFYIKFCNAYLERERLKFLNIYLKELDFIKVNKLKGQISNFNFFKNVIVVILKLFIQKITPNILVSRNKNILLTPTLKIKNET